MTEDCPRCGRCPTVGQLLPAHLINLLGDYTGPDMAEYIARVQALPEVPCDCTNEV